MIWVVHDEGILERCLNGFVCEREREERERSL